MSNATPDLSLTTPDPGHPSSAPWRNPLVPASPPAPCTKPTSDWRVANHNPGKSARHNFRASTHGNSAQARSEGREDARSAISCQRHHHSHSAPKRHPGEYPFALVHAAASGDQHAWSILVRRYSPTIRSVARRHRLGQADVDDVAQGTWLLLFRHLGQVREPAALSGWLTTTARRECLRVLRERARAAPFGDEPPEFESSHRLPGEALFGRERDDALWRGFVSLRASDQALLRLLVADPPAPYEEIAAALEMPIGSIGPTRQRALQRLRQELDSQGTLSLMTP